MGNVITNEEFAKQEIQTSKMKPTFAGLDFYEQCLPQIAGDRIKLLVVATELLEIARRNDPCYGLSPVAKHYGLEDARHGSA